MIGKVTFPAKGDRPGRSVTMHDDGRFEAEGPGAAEVEDYCRSRRADRPEGPADGNPGVRFLHGLAREVGGTAEIAPRPPGKEGVVY